MIIHLNKN